MKSKGPYYIEPFGTPERIGDQSETWMTTVTTHYNCLAARNDENRFCVDPPTPQYLNNHLIVYYSGLR